MIIAAVGMLLIIMLLAGIPIGFCLAVSGSVGLTVVGGWDSLLGILGTAPYRSAASFLLMAIPMFILMAELASAGNIAKDMFDLANKWIGHIPGGVGIATVISSAGFGTVSGSSTAAAATMSRIAIPEMLKLGYRKDVASGCVAAAGTLAIMIPPSIPLVLYGIITETSIGKLLIAGIVPGILTAFVYAAGLFFWAKKNPEAIPKIDPFSWKERLEALRTIWAVLLLISVVVGGLYSGMATPSEVAALGAFGCFLICLGMGRIGKKEIYMALERTVLTTTMIFTIIIGAMVFGYFLTITQASQNLIALIGSLRVAPWVIMLILILLYLVLGCFMDQVAILLITLPLTFPLATSIGYDAILFGIIVVKLTEIGLLTPPVGMNVFVVGGSTGIPLDTIFRGVFFFILLDSMTLLLFWMWPDLVLYVPSKLY